MLLISRFHAVAFSAAVCLMLFVSSAGAQNLLTNGNLDATSVSTQVLATPTGWTALANKTISGPFTDGMSSESFANVLDPGGNGLFFKPFQGTLATGDKITANLYQDKIVSAGQTLTMTGWAGAG